MMTTPAGRDQGSLTFVGAATMIVRYRGSRCSPTRISCIAGQRAYLGHGLSSARRIDPAVSVDELPPLNARPLSHRHGDRWDRVARRGLDHDLSVLTTPHASRRLQWRGFPDDRPAGVDVPHRQRRGYQRPGDRAAGPARPQAGSLAAALR